MLRDCQPQTTNARDTLSTEMATSSNLGQIEARDELRRRGLTVGGAINELRLRMIEDDAFGEIRGNLSTFSDRQLREVCRRRGLSSRGDRQELDDRIISYNQRKQSQQSSHEDPGWLNTGLPTPDDRLGPPTDNRVLGTRDSDVYYWPYSLYLRGYQIDNSTTEGAWTLQYWLLLHNRVLPSL